MLKKLDSRFVKYVISGGTAAIIEFAVFSLLFNYLFNLVSYKSALAQAISFCAGLVVSFILNRIWVFNSYTNKAKQFSVYLILALFNLGLSTIIVWILIEKLGFVPLISKISVMGLIVLWNYFIFQKIIFKTNHQAS